MAYAFDTISHIIGGEIVQKTMPEQDIVYLLTDTRRIVSPTASLFFALVGMRHDGHIFIKEAYRQGVRAFVVSQPQVWTDFPEAQFIVVADVLRGMQTLAAYHRAQFPTLDTVGITGSNGKTIVKEWLYQLLGPDFHIVRSPKSYNSQLGVPLSVWQIKAEHNLALFEAGISEVGGMTHLAKIIQPNTVIFTNLGQAHSEGFPSDAVKFKEKFILAAAAATVFMPYALCQQYRPQSAAKIWTWGTEAGADLQRLGTDIQGKHTLLHVRFKAEEAQFNLPFTDAASIDNACVCALFLLQKGYDLATIGQRLSRLEPIAMRLSLKSGINNCVVVDDAYSADVNALETALDFMNQQNQDWPKTVVLSDILQTGQDPDELYAFVARLLAEKKVPRLIGIGHDIQKIAAFLPQNIDFQHYIDTKTFLKQIKNTDYQNEIILVKGARPFAFEAITERFALKAHKTVLEINLNALSHNLLFFNKLLKPSVKMMVMVKASAYGNGSDEVARLLAFHRVDYLAVAYADEGIELRHAGIKTPIMVMNPQAASFDAMRRFNLEPELYSLNILREYVDFTRHTEGGAFKIHLKLDTGMHRLGFEAADVAALCALLRQQPAIEVASVFTHLAASDAAVHDGFTRQQVQNFEAMTQTITAALGYQPLRHVLNSSGIARFPDYQFDMVRLGIGLYGVDSSSQFQDRLQVVQTLKATISQIRWVPQTESVGYSRRGLLDRDARIATISIGYADGLPRMAGNGRFGVWLHGRLAPIVGSVCMDMTMIDITDIPEAQEGDEVEIFGQNQSVQVLADVIQTIPYEIFTSISQRVKRVYFQE